MKSATWKVRISLFLAVGLLVFAGACSGVRPVTEQTQASEQTQLECPLPDGVEAPAGPSVTAQQVEDGSASLTDFALAVRDQFVSESRGKTTSEQWAYVGCLFRQEGSPWHFGSTYLVELSLDGRVFLHTKDMALSGRQLNPAVYGAILHALGIDPTSLTDPAAAIAAFVAAAAGDGGPFDAAGVPGASGYATVYPLATGPRVLLVGFDLDASHLVPISEEALDYGDPPIAASEVVDRATLKAFVTAAGAYVVDLLESGDLAAVSKARIILRDPSGPWIDGPVYLSIMDRVSRQIMFHGGFPNRFELRRGGISRNVVTGELIVDQLIAAAESGPEGGFFEYYFDNPDDDSDSADIPKVGYARVFTAHIPLPDGTAFTTEFIMNSGFYLSADAHPTSGQTPLACPLPDGIDPPATPQVTAQQVEDGSASLTDFAMAVRDQFVSDPQRITTLEETAHIGCLFRQEGSPWRSGSTYLVELTPDGRVFLHAKDMALSGRQLKPAIYGAILHALGIAPAALTDPAAAMAAFAAAAAGDGGPFDAAGVAGASGYATVYGMQNPRVLVVGFDLDDSHLIPISEEALDYGDPPITASDVVDRATLKAFVTAAGEYSVRLLESGDLAALSKARVALRDPNGPWRDGPVYLSVMDHASRQIMFHGGFPDRFELRRGGISRNVVTGELIVDQLVAAAESGPEGGFFEYYFDNPADDSDSADIPKVGFARVFTANVPLPDGSSVPFNIIVNSGFYLSTDAHAASGEPQDDCPLIERYVPPVTAQQVEDGSASLKEFALAVSDQRGRMNINVVCLIRKEGSPWRSGSTYLIRLTPDGRVYTHAKDMSLSGRLLNPVIYAAILQALGIDPAALTDPAAARDAFAAAAAGDGGPFDVPGIAGASGYATIIHSESGVLQLAGFDLSESHLIPISDEEIDYGDPSITAGEVVDRETLKAFVTAAGEYFVEVLESGDMAAASRSRIGMRDPNGPWRHGSIYISVMERDSKLILFHGGFPDRFEYRKGGISRDAATGELVVDQLIAAAESGPEGGFWDYYFDNPDDDTDSAVPKVGYARVVTVNFTLPDGRVHPIDYIINSGFYLSTDAQAEAGQAQDDCPLPDGVEPPQAPRVTAQQVEDGSASLTEFALAVRDNFGSGGRGAAAVAKAIYFRCLFRQEGSPWRSGSTYLVQLTLDGRILVHAKEMALSGRQLNPAIYGAILHALGIDPAALTDPTAAMAALTTAAAGDGGPFDVPGIPGASGYASAYTPINVVLAGFDLDESHLVPISEEALDYGDPPITASDVVDRATLKAFVTAAGEYVVKLLESGEGLRANTKARIVLRDPNGPWRDGPVYVAMMERASKLITFHGAFPNRFELRRGGISRDIATGELVVDQLIAAAESGPEGGFWDYYFDNPDDDTDSAVPKVGYARVFTAHIPLANGGTLPYEFIVNSGFYPDADAHPASGQTQDDCPLPDGVEPPQAPRVTAQQVEDGSASLTEFALAVRDNFGSGGRGAAAVSKAIYFRCLFRQEGSPWRSGSTYLVQLTLDGRILVHAKEMALSGRQLDPAIYGAILHALGIDPAALTDPTAAMAALTTAAAGDGGPFDAAGVAGATGYASVYTPFNVVLAGFDLDESHLVPISEEALDYGDPPITASDVVDRATLKAFVTAAGEYVVKLLESGEGLRANTKARIVLRDPNGPWRDGPVYVAMMERVSKLITFHGAFPNRFELRRGGISRDIATGELVVDQLIAAAESGPEGGFWDYYFDNPDDDTDSAVPKVGYARVFTAHIPLANGGTLPYEFIVNSGFYPSSDAHPASGQAQLACPLPDGVAPPAAPPVTAQQVEDGNASLTDFALAVRDQFLSGSQGATTLEQSAYVGCLFRQEGSPWRSGSTYLVELTPDGRVFLHAKDMALSGRQLDPAVYGAILHAMGIAPAALTDPAAAMAAFAAAAAGDGGPFDAAGVAGASGYATVYGMQNPRVLVVGFDLDDSHLVPISEEALDYGDPPIAASEVVDRDTLKAFVTAAGEYSVRLLESGDLAALSKARVALRDPNGPWRDGPVYVSVMDLVSKQIMFHGGFPDRFELRRGGISRDVATGELIVDQLIAAAESSPEGGFWEYYFDNPDDDTDSAVPKVGYARVFTANVPLPDGSSVPFNIIVNSGFYPSSDAHPASGQAQLECPLPEGVESPPDPSVTAQQVEEGSASLTEFALAARDNYVSVPQGERAVESTLYLRCLFRQEGSPWLSGSTYLVQLTPDGRVYVHAQQMSLSGRQLNPVIYGAILHALGIDPAALTDPAAAMAAFAAAAHGDGGPFNVPDIADASGYATVIVWGSAQNPYVLLAGFELDDSHLVPIGEEALDYGDPPITASDVVDRDTLKAFVTAAGEYFVELIESDDPVARSNVLAKVRVILRDPNGPWIDGPVYLSIMDRASKLIQFHGGFPDRFELRQGGISRDIATGELIVDQLIAAAESGPEGGFWEYYFDNPADDSDSVEVPKVGYARVFTANVPLPDGGVFPYEFIVNSGFYLTPESE